jgi:predicted DNA-binding protein (UPF0251 family)
MGSRRTSGGGWARKDEWERINKPASAAVSKETIQEIFASLTPAQLVAVALRLEGLTMEQTADELNISRSAVSLRLVNARMRIARCVPSMMDDVLSRKKAQSRYQAKPRQCAECGILISKKATWCRYCNPQAGPAQSPLQEG